MTNPGAQCAARQAPRRAGSETKSHPSRTSSARFGQILVRSTHRRACRHGSVKCSPLPQQDMVASPLARTRRSSRQPTDYGTDATPPLTYVACQIVVCPLTAHTHQRAMRGTGTRNARASAGVCCQCGAARETSKSFTLILLHAGIYGNENNDIQKNRMCWKQHVAMWQQ